jgi:hypothetical protein
MTYHLSDSCAVDAIMGLVPSASVPLGPGESWNVLPSDDLDRGLLGYVVFRNEDEGLVFRWPLTSGELTPEVSECSPKELMEFVTDSLKKCSDYYVRRSDDIMRQMLGVVLYLEGGKSKVMRTSAYAISELSEEDRVLLDSLLPDHEKRASEAAAVQAELARRLSLFSTSSPARTGYEAYGQAADWKAWDGKPMPRWHELRPDIVMKWEKAAAAILSDGPRLKLAPAREEGGQALHLFTVEMECSVELGESGLFVSRCRPLHIVSQGRTVDEAARSLKDSVQLVLEKFSRTP